MFFNLLQSCIWCRLGPSPFSHLVHFYLFFCCCTCCYQFILNLCFTFCAKSCGTHMSLLLCVFSITISTRFTINRKKNKRLYGRTCFSFIIAGYFWCVYYCSWIMLCSQIALLLTSVTDILITLLFKKKKFL